MNLEPAHWRLIQSPAASGAWNMAVDEAILESVGAGTSLPTLRLYAWEPACLSLGYAQSSGDVDPTRLKRFGWDLVRRPTGGRAILHVDELTYSVTGPVDEPRLTGGVLESYHRLSEALQLALHRLGLPVTAQDGQSRSQFSGPVCFEVPSSYEITVHSKKLIGSAQARRKDGVLQHGSLPLCGDLTRITQALVFPGEEQRQEAARRLLERATTVEVALGRTIPWEEAAAEFVSAFSEALNIHFSSGSLSPAEESRAHKLVNEKFANPAWTERV